MKKLVFSEVQNLDFKQKFEELLKEVYQNDYEKLHVDYVSRYEQGDVEDFIDFVDSCYYCVLCE